jgi:ATP-dependent DNA helicase RecQ
MQALKMDETLRNTFGFKDFRAGQREVVEKLVAGRSTLAVFPTGAGKSLCYQLPALNMEGLTIVVSPLIALMKDQIDFLASKGIAAARLDSSLSAQEARATWDAMRSGSLKLLYIAPERFSSERFLERMRRTKIALMVVDEAHCISEWGHNFRPDYLKLAKVAKSFGVKRVLALTATATPNVAEDICRAFEISPADYVNTGFHRSNLIMRATPCTARERDELLLQRLKERPGGATIVYVTLQRTAESVAEMLKDNGFQADAYHAGMKPDRRNAVQDWFMKHDEAIVVATIAFGMGIDKSNIRYVYHYNIPKTLENYSQETGRAGRDDQPSTCEMFACPDDCITLENFSYGDTPTPESVEAFVQEVLAHGEKFDVSQYELSFRHDIRALVVATLLCYLELEGVIEPTGPFYATYKFQPNRPIKDILFRFSGERAEFLEQLFVSARKGKTWYTIDTHQAAIEMGEDRSRLIRALNFLEEDGDLTLQATGVRHGYRRLDTLTEPVALARKLAARFQDAEKRDIARIRDVVDLASNRRCIVRRLLDYFGEDLGRDCGHCDRCLGDQVHEMPTISRKALPKRAHSEISQLRKEGHAALSIPRQMARFLCGLSSPATSRGKPALSKHAMFGRAGNVAFADVLSLCEELMA